MTDAVLPRGLRRARKAAARFTTPLLPDEYLLLLNPLWSVRELRGRVVKVVPETADASRTRRIGFLAGNISVPDDFDTMYQEEIIRLFEGEPDAPR